MKYNMNNNTWRVLIKQREHYELWSTSEALEWLKKTHGFKLEAPKERKKVKNFLASARKQKGKMKHTMNDNTWRALIKQREHYELWSTSKALEWLKSTHGFKLETPKEKEKVKKFLEFARKSKKI